MESENAPENAWVTPAEAQKELGIGESQYYVYTAELGIKSKRIKGKAYLSQEQMQRLRNYKQPQNALATVDNSSKISFEESVINSTQGNEEISAEEEEDIWRRAGEIKAKHLTAKDLLALHLAAGMKLEDLDADLQEQVRTINTAANPETMGKSIAGTAEAMLQKRRLHQT